MDGRGFPDWLRAQVGARGWRQRDLARETGVSQQTASRWLLGHSIPSGVHARALAQAFGVTTDEVVDLLASPDGTAADPDGRDAELARLRRRVEELEAALARRLEA